MAGVRFDRNYNKVLSGLKKLGATNIDLQGIMAPIGNKVVGEAKRLTPVRSGRLRATVRTNKAARKVVIRAGTKAVNYASFVEFGSVHNEAESMVKTAITDNEDYAAKALDKGIEDLARRYGVK